MIAYIENPDFIIKQQEYLESKARLKLKQLDLDRQQSLVDAKAGVLRTLQKVQAEVEILEAKTNGLAKQLSYLGINTNGLSSKNIKQQIAITSPMSGFISNIDLHNGMYAQTTKPLMEIIADDHLHLELDVFEKDIAQVAVGQRISYAIPALGDKIFEGEISVIGKEFDSKTKTVRIHGHLDGEKPQFIKDLFVNAKIWLNDNVVSALPEKSVINQGASSFIFVAKNDTNSKETEFQKIMVITGVADNGYVAVKLLDEIPEGMQVVVEGAYFVYAQSMAGELKHEH